MPSRDNNGEEPTAPIQMDGKPCYAKRAAGADAIESLRKEFLLLKRMVHPLWPEPIDFQREGDTQAVLILSHAPGLPIDQLDEKALAIQTKIEIARQILSALQVLHSVRHVHLDLKPEHVLVEMIDEQPHVTLIDLGMAAPFGNVISAGNIKHLAPELIRGPQPAAATMDLYGFGILFFRLITGTDPFWSHSHEESFRKKLNASLAAVEPETYGGLSRVLFALLSAEPVARQTSAAEVWGQLRDVHSPKVQSLQQRPLVVGDLLPLVGRETLTRSFESWVTSNQDARHLRCTLIGQRGSGKQRLRNFFLVVAESLNIERDAIEVRTAQPQDAPAVETDPCQLLELSVHPLSPEDSQDALRGRFQTKGVLSRVSDVCLGVPGLIQSLAPHVPDIDDLDIDPEPAAASRTWNPSFMFEDIDPPEEFRIWFHLHIQELDDDEVTALCLLTLFSNHASLRDQEDVWAVVRNSARDLGPALRISTKRGIARNDGRRYEPTSALWRKVVESEFSEQRRELASVALGYGRIPLREETQLALHSGEWDRLFEKLPSLANSFFSKNQFGDFADLFADIIDSVPSEYFPDIHRWAGELCLSRTARKRMVSVEGLLSAGPDSPGKRLLNADQAFRQLDNDRTKKGEAAARQAVTELSEPLTLWADATSLERTVSFGLQLKILAKLGDTDAVIERASTTLNSSAEGQPEDRTSRLGCVLDALDVYGLIDPAPYFRELEARLDSANELTRLRYYAMRAIWSQSRGLEDAQMFVSSAIQRNETLQISRFETLLLELSAGIAFENGSLQESFNKCTAVLRAQFHQASIVTYANLSTISVDMDSINLGLSYLRASARIPTPTQTMRDIYIFASQSVETQLGDHVAVTQTYDNPHILQTSLLAPSALSLYGIGRKDESSALLEDFLADGLRAEETSDGLELLVHLSQMAIDKDDRELAESLYDRIADFEHGITLRSRLKLELLEGCMITRGWRTIEPADAEPFLTNNLAEIQRYHYRFIEWRAHWNLAAYYDSQGRPNDAVKHWKQARTQLEDRISGLNDGRFFDTYQALPAVKEFRALVKARLQKEPLN